MLAEVTAVIGALNAVNGAISTLKETKSNVDSISKVFGRVTQAATGLAAVEEKVRTGKLVLSTTDAMKISMAKKQVADYEKQLKDLFIYSGNGDMYNEMNHKSLKVLYDDTDDRAGTKLARADLIGLPYQIIIGPKGIKDQLYDLKCRKSGDISRLSYNELLNFVQTNK